MMASVEDEEDERSGGREETVDFFIQNLVRSRFNFEV